MSSSIAITSDKLVHEAMSERFGITDPGPSPTTRHSSVDVIILFRTKGTDVWSVGGGLVREFWVSSEPVIHLSPLFLNCPLPVSAHYEVRIFKKLIFSEHDRVSLIKLILYACKLFKLFHGWLST